MVKSERDEVMSQLTSMLFSAMIDDIVLDATLQSHYEVQKLNTVCEVCHTRCGSAHASSSATTAPSRTGTPDVVSQSQPTNASSSGAGTVTGANTPTNGKSDGNIYFDCLNCKRQIASNRYAPHLSACMGVGPGNRRGASRNNAVVKSKMSAEAGRSASPYLGSDNGADDPTRNQGSKGKGKSKTTTTTHKDDAEFNLHRKRPGSPQISPKKSKKTKTLGSPLKNSTKVMPPPSSNLRASSATSDVVQEREGSASASIDNESRFSVFSPEATPVSPTSSTDSVTNSATLTNGTTKSGSAKPPRTEDIGTGKNKSATPSRPPPPVHKMPDPNNYVMMGYEGEETGSSTDSESD